MNGHYECYACGRRWPTHASEATLTEHERRYHEALRFVFYRFEH